MDIERFFLPNVRQTDGATKLRELTNDVIISSESYGVVRCLPRPRDFITGGKRTFFAPFCIYVRDVELLKRPRLHVRYRGMYLYPRFSPLGLSPLARATLDPSRNKIASGNFLLLTQRSVAQRSAYLSIADPYRNN